MSAESLLTAGVPKQFVEISFEDFTFNAEAETAIREILDNIDEEMRRGCNVMITGKPRVGKTMLASIVLGAAHERAWISRFVPYATYVRQLLKRISLQNIIEHHTDDEALDRWTKLNHKIDSYFAAELLVIDDLGKENPTSYAVREFEYMLRRRHDHGFSTIITTNVLPREFESIYGEGVSAFLNDEYQWVGVVRTPVRA